MRACSISCNIWRQPPLTRITVTHALCVRREACSARLQFFVRDVQLIPSPSSAADLEGTASGSTIRSRRCRSTSILHTKRCSLTVHPRYRALPLQDLTANGVIPFSRTLNRYGQVSCLKYDRNGTNSSAEVRSLRQTTAFA
jgi:hypothetical protein